MRRGVKVVIWVGVFTACAGAGAYVAAHTNPFPPGVEDPGARTTTPPPTSAPPAVERWSLSMHSATRHELHVGGACRSSWTTTGSVTVDPDGSVKGRAVARVGAWGCDFPVAQVQTRVVRMTVRGRRSGDRILLDLTIASSSPVGSQDLGGFTSTIEDLVPRADIADGAVGTRARVARPDGDLGRYVNDSRIQLTCTTGC